jgi:hypothetical protein
MGAIIYSPEPVDDPWKSIKEGAGFIIVMAIITWLVWS